VRGRRCTDDARPEEAVLDEKSPQDDSDSRDTGIYKQITREGAPLAKANPSSDHLHGVTVVKKYHIPPTSLLTCHSPGTNSGLSRMWIAYLQSSARKPAESQDPRRRRS